ncbi:MAG: glycosyltransferase [Opitutaceae bacterium]|nr:glycosyltransferase [Opitutaceae bacterium]MBP9913990.1 glycosyltransferase [Opitutaceae bacterium]
MALQSHIDQPDDWSHPSRCVIIRGWCFDESAGAITGIRLRTADRILDGVVGMPRPDVPAALPAAPDANTGFEIRGTLPAGRQRLVIEARTPDGAWAAIMSRDVRIKRLLLPLWLGGGDWTELMFFQMPAHMAHPPRPVRPETFPAPRPGLARPKLSIVTPSYQQARYLAETMRSVLDQGFLVEYVVQDGGSTDGSVELIRQHASRLVAWTSAPDAGQADAIATGFARTSGGPDDVMAWINSDDYYQPGALAFVADYFAAHPEVDVIYGHRIVVDEASQEIARWFLPAHDAAVLRLNDFVPQETLFWRRRIWERAGGLDPSFNFAMDWDLLLRFDAAGARIVRVPWFLACFRAHAAQKTAAFMHSTGQSEITRLRERTHDRHFPAHEIERHPRLMAYLRKSALIQFLWRLGFRTG